MGDLVARTDADDLEHPLIDQMEDAPHPFREGDRIITGFRLGFVEYCWSRVVDLATLPDDCVPWIIHTITAVMDDGRRISCRIEGHVDNFDPAPASAPHPPWRRVLGNPHGPTTIESVQAGYKFRAKRWHPDHGGSDAAMAMLNVARDRALTELNGSRRAS